MSTIHKGVVPIMSATSPEGTRCSAHTTAPFPPVSSRSPTTAAAPHSKRTGAKSPRRRLNAKRSPPAMTNRMPADTNGGMVSTTNRIARYVDPQIM